LGKPPIGKNTIPSEKFEQSLFFKSALESGLSINRTLSLRFTASLLTKPFVILTGLSGSGKTKLAQSFAMWICENEDQYCLVPVGADWTNREPLLGFPNALKNNEYVKPDNKVLDLLISAIKNQDEPYFLILDEMNLSHVERYFADFLSVMESGNKLSLHNGLDYWNDVPAQIELPNNLFIIGTVNIDETTYMFSPKVLDRASVIEFRVTAEEMKNYLDKNTKLELDKLKSAGANMAASFIKLAKDKSLKTNDSQVLQTELLNFFSELKKTGAEFGYRSASEIFRFAAVVDTIEPDWSLPEIIDAAIIQKLLPKVHGSRRKLEPVLKSLGNLCLQSGENFDDFVGSKSDINFNDSERIKYPLSLEKILRMYHGLIDNGFTSYAEA
jgi:5-methylcytosine-specific restriction protein B